MTKNNHPEKLSPWGQLKTLPPLLSLPVIRDTFCCQEVTDEALRLLWDKKPDLVRVQGNLEISNFDQTYLMELWRIVDFFRNEACQEIIVPKSRLGMLDLLFELSRRLRKALDIEEWKLRGRPLAKGPDGPFPPEIPPQPIKTVRGREDYFGLTQRMADRIVDATYKQAPHLFYEKVECFRRGGIWPSDIGLAMDTVIRGEVLTEEWAEVKSESWLLRGINGEITYRLVNLCEIEGVFAVREAE